MCFFSNFREDNLKKPASKKKLAFAESDVVSLTQSHSGLNLISNNEFGEDFDPNDKIMFEGNDNFCNDINLAENRISQDEIEKFNGFQSLIDKDDSIENYNKFADKEESSLLVNDVDDTIISPKIEKTEFSFISPEPCIPIFNCCAPKKARNFTFTYNNKMPKCARNLNR